MAVQILKNRGILLEMATENGAKWLKQKKISKGFEQCFLGMVTIKEKTYQVVIQFLPTRLRHCLKEITAHIEEENKMSRGSIVSTKWLRNPDNWVQIRRKHMQY
jgi:hypothetical protein